MIIAVDPGQHTGVAMRFDNDAWGTVLADKVPDANERLDMILSLLRDCLEKGTCTTVVIENFKTMGYLSKYGIETIELIGAIKGLCYLYAIPIARQDPQHRLPFERQATVLLKERSRTLNIPTSDHEVSALAHLLRYEYSQQTHTASSVVLPSQSTHSSDDSSTDQPGASVHRNAKFTVRRVL